MVGTHPEARRLPDDVDGLASVGVWDLRAVVPWSKGVAEGGYVGVELQGEAEPRDLERCVEACERDASASDVDDVVQRPAGVRVAEDLLPDDDPALGAARERLADESVLGTCNKRG